MIELLGKQHHKEVFDCGNEQLTRYLNQQASQDVSRKLAACFVLTEARTSTIIGYYTLSSNSISLSSLPEQIQKNYRRVISQFPLPF
jgi:hypothetical protein